MTTYEQSDGVRSQRHLGFLGPLAGAMLLTLGVLSGCGNTDGDKTECGEGTSLQEGKCILQSSGCGPKTVLDDGSCVPADKACGAGTTLDQKTGECVPYEDVVCGEGTKLVDGTCELTDEAKSAEEACQNGTVYVPEQDACEVPDTICGDGTERDAETGKCVRAQAECGTGTAYSSESEQCEPTEEVCGANTTFNAETGTCVHGRVFVGDCSNPESLPAEITEETTLPTNNCYTVDQVVTVKDSGTLNISPGVEIAFEKDAGLKVVGNKATLTAEGTEQDPIRLTGAQQTKGYWKGILFEVSKNATNALEHVTVEYAGQNGWNDAKASPAAITLSTDDWAAPTKVRISNVTVRQSGGHGLYIETALGSVVAYSVDEFTDNVFAQNAEAPISMPIYVAEQFDLATSNFDDATGPVELTHGELDVPVTLPALEVAYLIQENVDVTGFQDDDNGSLTIEAGATVEFAQNAGLSTSYGASISAVGGQGNRITLTGHQDQKGFWRGVAFFDSQSSQNKLEYVDVEYAGSEPFNNDVSGAGVVVGKDGLNADPAAATIHHTTVRNSDGYGLWAGDQNAAGALDGFESNSFENNAGAPLRLPPWLVGKIDDKTSFSANGNQYVEVSGATIRNTSVDIRDRGVPYRITGVIEMRGGELVVHEGVTAAFENGAGLKANYQGAILIGGEMGNRVRLTGVRKLAGSWSGIGYNDTDNALNRITHATIEYAGGRTLAGDRAAALELSDAAGVTLEEVAIDDSSPYAVDLVAGNLGSPTIRSCTNVSFTGNNQIGGDKSIWTNACGAP